MLSAGIARLQHAVAHMCQNVSNWWPMGQMWRATSFYVSFL